MPSGWDAWDASKPKGGGKSTKPSAGTKQAASKPKQDPKSFASSQEQLISLLGRLSAVDKPSKRQQKKLGALLTDIKPHDVRQIGTDLELPQETTLVLRDAARQAQGISPPPGAKARAKVLGLAADFERLRDERDASTATAAPSEEFTETSRALTEVGGRFTRKSYRKLLEEAGIEGALADQMLADQATMRRSYKAEQESEKGAFLLDVLDYLGRPGQAVLGTLAEGPEGTWKGLTGEDSYTPIEAVQRAVGVSEAEAKANEASLPGAVRFTGNLAGSIVTDPLTYVSFGTTAAARQATIRAGEQIAAAGLRSADDVAKGLAQRGLASLDDAERALLDPKTLKLLRGAQGGMKFAGRTVIDGPSAPGARQFAGNAADLPVIGTLERAVVPRAGIKQAARRGEAWAQGTADRLEKLMARLHGSQHLEDRTLAARIQGALRSNELGDPDDLREIVRALENSEKPLTEAQEAVRQVAADDFARMLDEERALGILGDQPMRFDDEIGQMVPFEGNVADGYFPHNLPPGLKGVRASRALKQAEERIPRGSPFTQRPGGYTKGRTLPGTIDEINAAAGRQVFDDDLARGWLKRGMEHNRDVANRNFVDEVMTWTDDTGEPILKPVPPDMPAAEIAALEQAGMRQIQVPGVGPVMVHAEIAGDVRRFATTVTNDAAVAAVRRGFDKWHAWWKSQALFLPPTVLGYLNRNMVSNWFLASFLPERGVRATIKEYAQALKAQAAITRGFKDAADPLAFVDDAMRQKIDDAFHTGVIDSGFVGTDIAEPLGQVVRPRLRDVGAKQVAKRVGRRANPLSPDFGPTAVGKQANWWVENNARLALFLRNYDALGPDGAAALVRKYLFDYADLTPLEQGIKSFWSFYTWTRKSVPLLLESMVKTPGRWSRIQQVREGLLAEGEDPGVHPEWMDAQLGIPIEGGMFMPDLPYTTLSEAVEDPATFLFSAWGGPTSLAKTWAENQAGESLFSHRNLRIQEESPIYLQPFDDMTRRSTVNLLEQLIPGLGKARTLFPTTEADEAAQTRRLLSMAGVNWYPLDDATRRGEILRRLSEAQDEITDLGAEGIEVPTLTDLRKKTKKNGGGGSAWDAWDNQKRGRR